MRSHRRLTTVLLVSLVSLLTTGVIVAESPQEWGDLRLGRTVLPLFEAIELQLDPSRLDYTGQARVELDVLERTTTFRFHAERMELRRVALKRGMSDSFPVTYDRGPLGLVSLTAAQPLEPGRYVLEIDFANTFGTSGVGLYRIEFRGDAYLFTQFEPDDAREAFPVWDEPAFKIPYQLTISIPEGHSALSNTPVEADASQNGIRTFRFAKTKPLPSYLLAIAAGPLESVPIAGLGVPGGVVTPRGHRHLTGVAAEITPPLLAAAEGYFGSRYPYEKLDLIAIPDFWVGGAMENAGAITFLDNVLLLNTETASTDERRRLAFLIAHELSHMWFGDLVTMEWWDDLWLNESFADWLAAKIVDEVFPGYQYRARTVQGADFVMSADARPSAQAIRRRVLPTDNLFENVGTQYLKGRAVLAMFEQWVGPETFRRGVHEYLERHAWKNATATDMWAAVAGAAGVNVSAAMATFIEQPGVPLISVEPLGSRRIRLTQRRFLNYGVSAPPLVWQIPVVLKYPGEGGVHTKRVLLNTSEMLVDFDEEPRWVLPNAEGRGYFRFLVPASMLEEMAAAPAALSTPERVSLIANASALMGAGLLGGESLLRFLECWTGDPESSVTSTMLDVLESVELALIPEHLDTPFAHWVRRLLAPALDRIGLEPRDGEAPAVSALRPRLLAYLGTKGRDERVLAHARKLAAQYMDNPASVDGAIADVALRLAARHGDRRLFEVYRTRFESAPEPAVRQRYLQALGAFREPALTEEALTYALRGPLRGFEKETLADATAEGPRGRERVWRWMTENYGELTNGRPSHALRYLPYYASGCEAERVDAAREFFSSPERQAPGVETTLGKVADQVSDCVRLREREGTSVQRYLEGASAGVH